MFNGKILKRKNYCQFKSANFLRFFWSGKVKNKSFFKKNPPVNGGNTKVLFFNSCYHFFLFPLHLGDNRIQGNVKTFFKGFGRMFYKKIMFGNMYFNLCNFVFNIMYHVIQF